MKGIYELYGRCRRDPRSCQIIIFILNLLVYNSTIQYSTIAIIVYDSNCHRTIPHYIMSCGVVHKNVVIL